MRSGRALITFDIFLTLLMVWVTYQDYQKHFGTETEIETTNE